MTTVDPRSTLNWRHARCGRQCKWEDILVKVFGDDWMKKAVTSEWPATLSKFIDGAYASLSRQPPERRFEKDRNSSIEDCKHLFIKEPRLVTWEPQQWSNFDGPRRLEVLGDSNLIINWVSGVWTVKFRPYERCVARVHAYLHSLVAKHEVRPRTDTADFCRHIYREFNHTADRLANKYQNTWHIEPHHEPPLFVRGFFDGSCKAPKAAYGWVVYGASELKEDVETNWTILATKSGVLPDGATITAAELEGALSLTSFLSVYYQSYNAALANISQHTCMDYAAVQTFVLADLV